MMGQGGFAATRRALIHPENGLLFTLRHFKRVFKRGDFCFAANEKWRYIPIIKSEAMGQFNIEGHIKDYS